MISSLFASVEIVECLRPADPGWRKIHEVCCGGNVRPPQETPRSMWAVHFRILHDQSSLRYDFEKSHAEKDEWEWKKRKNKKRRKYSSPDRSKHGGVSSVIQDAPPQQAQTYVRSTWVQLLCPTQSWKSSHVDATLQQQETGQVVINEPPTMQMQLGHWRLKKNGARLV